MLVYNDFSFCSPSKGKVRLHPDPRQCQFENEEPGHQILRNIHCKYSMI